MKKQYQHELIGRVEAYWDGLTCQQKAGIYFDVCGVELYETGNYVPECPEYHNSAYERPEV